MVARNGFSHCEDTWQARFGFWEPTGPLQGSLVDSPTEGEQLT